METLSDLHLNDIITPQTVALIWVTGEKIFTADTP